ncbi:MAG: hypothetical protein ACT4P7_02870 [Gemmatimonadaceae bacterium]
MIHPILQYNVKLRHSLYQRGDAPLLIAGTPEAAGVTPNTEASR